jgi:DNA-binding beta-propeller fold protein YncE
VRHQLTARALTALAASLALSGVWAGVAQASDPLGYVTDEQAGTLQQVDLTTGAVGPAIPVGSRPVALAITPDGATAYVADYGSSEVVPVSLATGDSGTPIPLSDRPASIAIAPNGTTAYVVSDSGREWPINLSTGRLGNPSSIPVNSDAIAITPGGVTAWITNIADGTLTPFTLSTGATGAPINLPVSEPDAVAITPGGSTAYVASNSAGTLTPVTLSTGVSGPPIPAGQMPTSVAISADGNIAYVTNFSTGQVTPVSLVTDTAGTPIPVGPDPSAIAVAPADSTITTPQSWSGATGPGSSPAPGSAPVLTTLGNQQLTLALSKPAATAGSAQSCHAPSSTLRMTLKRRTLRRGAKLKLRYVTFTLVKQVKRVKRLPATVRFSLRKLKAGTYRVKARVYYSEKVVRARPHHRRRKITITIKRTLRSRFAVC